MDQCPGCNSGGVAQYIRAALLELSVRKGFRLEEKTLGIIGVGHVGAKVDQLACGLGIRTLLNDPPRARKEGPSGFTDLTDLLRQSDIVTIHVPLNREGPDSTLHLVDKYFLDQIKPGAILINTSRGEVMDEKEVVECIKDGRQSGTGAGPSALVIDVWENEPDINRELLALAEIATPHIAGYSINGKYNATRMIADAVKDFFRLEIQPIPPLLPEIDGKRLKGSKPEYDISVDDRKLRESPESFEQLRNNYPERWE